MEFLKSIGLGEQSDFNRLAAQNTGQEIFNNMIERGTHPNEAGRAAEQVDLLRTKKGLDGKNPARTKQQDAIKAKRQSLFSF